MPDATQVRARDLMRTEVVTLASDDTIESALELFEDARISGAPVVADGRLLGMLTLADVARSERAHARRTAAPGGYEFAEPAGEELTDEWDPDEIFYRKEDYSPEVLGRELVGEWMSRGVLSVPAEASLERVCQTMVDNQVHRVCVTEGEKLLGVISSFDVVRHVARRAQGAARKRRRR